MELAELLAPMQAKLGLQRVTVYAPDGTEILHMGPRQTGLDIAPLIHAARAGRTESAAASRVSTSIPCPGLRSLLSMKRRKAGS